MKEDVEDTDGIQDMEDTVVIAAADLGGNGFPKWYDTLGGILKEEPEDVLRRTYGELVRDGRSQYEAGGGCVYDLVVPSDPCTDVHMPLCTSVPELVLEYGDLLEKEMRERFGFGPDHVREIVDGGGGEAYGELESLFLGYEWNADVSYWDTERTPGDLKDALLGYGIPPERILAVPEDHYCSVCGQYAFRIEQCCGENMCPSCIRIHEPGRIIPHDSLLREAGWDGAYLLDDGRVITCCDYVNFDPADWDGDEPPVGSVYYDILDPVTGEPADGGEFAYGADSVFSDFEGFVTAAHGASVFERIPGHPETP